VSSNTDIIALLDSDADKAVDQIIADAKRLHTVVNGTGTEQAITEDGSLIPSVRKALLDNLYFKTPPLPWKNGSSITEFNQLYSFTDVSGNVTWWYAPGATLTTPVVMGDSPINNGKFRVFLDKTNISDIYAPITSPNFKGNARVPLAAKGDKTDTIASTAWVQREVEDLVEKVDNANKGDFENITVSNDAVLENTYVNGEFIVQSEKIDASASEISARRIRVVGQTAEIAFEQNAAPPAGVSTRTNIKPYQVATGKLTADDSTLTKVQVGDLATAEDSLNVDGYIRGDYLHLEGNNRNSTDKPQLLVDGIAEIGTLRITQGIEGVKADVDGLDIKPNSANITEDLQVGGDTALVGKLTVTGKTKVTDLEVTGSVTGVAISVDNKDIKPRNVTTGSITATGDLQISGTTTATGKITTQDLEVLGKLTANLDLSGSDLVADTLKITNQATIKDLVVTGNTMGVKGDVTGEDIKPATVEATGSIKGDSLQVTGGATIGGDLALTGEFKPTGIDTGSLLSDEITVDGDLTQTSGTAKLNNLVVTGTTTGVTADVSGKDITPATVETTGDVAVGGGLTVTGKSTLGDVEFTGTLTGLDLDLSQNDVTVKSLTTAGKSTLADVVSETIENSNKITTKDIQVTGNILDADGNPVNTFDVTNKDILPNSVQSATYVKTKTLEVEQTSEFKDKVTLDAGLAITGGDVLMAAGKATVNDLQVNGALTDENGNTIGTAESIEGKDIKPKSVVASVSVEAASITSSGDVNAVSLNVSGDTNLGVLTVAEDATFDNVTITGQTVAGSTQVDSLRVKRVAGSDNKRFTVEGDSDLQGDLNVSGTITGEVDLSAKDISMKNLATSEDITTRNLTASATVKGANGLFGEADQTSSQFGLQSLSNARVDKDLEVGGNLRVSGTMSGNLDLSGKDITPDDIAATGDISGVDITSTGTLTANNLVVNGTTTFAEGNTFQASQVKSSLFVADPGADITVSSGSWTPDGLRSIYNVTVTADTVINPIASLPGAGTYYFYIEQDSVGGHAVTFDASYLKIGSDTVNTAASSLSLIQVIYRGKGNLFDYTILRRG